MKLLILLCLAALAVAEGSERMKRIRFLPHKVMSFKEWMESEVKFERLVQDFCEKCEHKLTTQYPNVTPDDIHKVCNPVEIRKVVIQKLQERQKIKQG